MYTHYDFLQDEAYLALCKKFFVVSSGVNGGNNLFVTIGNTGRDMNGTRTFKATKWTTLLRQVERAYGDGDK